MRQLLLTLIVVAVLFLSGNPLMGQNITYGNSWLGGIINERILYIRGFVDGQNVILEELKIKPGPHLNLYVGVYGNDMYVIDNIMTQFYRDPANTYIHWGIMIVIANKKLQGESVAEIERLLSEARKLARD